MKIYGLYSTILYFNRNSIESLIFYFSNLVVPYFSNLITFLGRGYDSSFSGVLYYKSPRNIFD